MKRMSIFSNKVRFGFFVICFSLNGLYAVGESRDATGSSSASDRILLVKNERPIFAGFLSDILLGKDRGRKWNGVLFRERIPFSWEDINLVMDENKFALALLSYAYFVRNPSDLVTVPSLNQDEKAAFIDNIKGRLLQNCPFIYTVIGSCLSGKTDIDEVKKCLIDAEFENFISRVTFQYTAKELFFMFVGIEDEVTDLLLKNQKIRLLLNDKKVQKIINEAVLN